MHIDADNPRPAIIGMLTPSSNTVVEPYTSALTWPLFPAVSVHFGRLRVRRIALDGDSDRQFGLEPFLQAADLLMDAKPDIVAWNGTSASWLGFEKDERLCDVLEEQFGVRSTSAVLSLNRLLERFNVHRLGLVSPYTADVQEKIIENYRSIGIETVAEAHSDRSDNFSFAELDENAIAQMCRDVARAKPDAIVVLCTNMRGPMIAARLESELGVPVMDSVAFTLWGCLDALDIPTQRLENFGKIFA